VAGGHARAAVGDHLAGMALQQGCEAFAQLHRAEEAPVGREVVGERRADRSRDMPGHWVDRLDFAVKARQGAGVQQWLVERVELGKQLLRLDDQTMSGAPEKLPFRAMAGCVSSGRLAALHALKPPSSTNTSSCLPSQASSHQARAANAPGPSSYSTI